MFSKSIYASWMRGAQQEKLKDILKNVKPKGRVLDVGSGTGFLEEHLEGVYCIDLDKENLRKSKGIRILADGNHLPFKAASFETVFCIDSVHLLEGLNEFKRVLKNEGIAVISSFCNKYNKEDKIEELKNRLREWRIEKEFFAGSTELDAVVMATKDLRVH